MCGYINGHPLVCCPQNINNYPRHGYDDWSGEENDYWNWNRYGGHRRNRFRPGKHRRPNKDSDEEDEVTEPNPSTNDPFSIAKTSELIKTID